jgi:hypothetical protein
MSVPYQTLADAVLLLHLGVVLFVVLGLPAIFIGNRLHWPWANNLGWRTAHLGAIALVTLQAWLGRYCPLTYLEIWLREQAGEAGYTSSFVQHGVERLIYFHAPLWVFALIYTAFGLLVAWAWWRHPPRRHI